MICLYLIVSVFSTGEKWKRRRRQITPTFHFKILNQFIQVFEEQSNILVSILKVRKLCMNFLVVFCSYLQANKIHIKFPTCSRHFTIGIPKSQKISNLCHRSKMWAPCDDKLIAFQII
jgi:hypothetical protein